MADPACLLVHNSTKDLESRQIWLQIYPRDVVVKKPARPISHSPGIKAEIFEFSTHSRQRLLHVCRNSGHLIKSQFLLTYPTVFPSDGQAVKAQLNQFLTYLRRQFSGVHYLWVLEFQERGAPHIHIFLSLDVNASNQQWLGKTWVSIINGSADALRFHLHPKNFFSWEMKSGQYLSKEYLAKSVQKSVPEQYKNVGRFWGHSRSMKPKFVTVNPDEIEDPTIVARLFSTVRIATKQFEKRLYSIKSASIARKREKTQEGGKPPHISRRNRRKKVMSYTLTLMTGLFAQLVPYIINGGLYT